MQTPRLVVKRNHKVPLMFTVLLVMGALWIGTPLLINFARSLQSDSQSTTKNDVQTLKPQPGSDSDPEPPMTQAEREKKAAEEEFERQSVKESSSLNFLDAKLDDPMAQFTVGFPNEPLTVEGLKFCDPESTIMLHGSYRCPDDPTCLKCVNPHQIERFKNLIEAFRNPEIEKARKDKIAEDFKGQHTVVLFTFNFAHSDLFLNWACSVNKLGMNVKDFTLVVPCDDKSAALVKKLGFKHVDSAWHKLLKWPIKSKESMWGQDHADINNVALFSMVDLVNLGFHVFVHDADVAWFKDPFPFFKNAIRRRDFLGMLAPFWNSMGPVNTGLLYLAPTNQMKIFLKSMENSAMIKGTSDQKLWNTVLRHFIFQQLEWRLLPQAVVYKYSGRRAEPPDGRSLLIHALGTNKRQKLARFSMWHLKQDCPFYDAESAALSEKELAQANPNP